MKLSKLLFTGGLLLMSATSFAQSSKYKCMLQMSSYTGEGAYIVVSLINPKGAYEKTLYVMGEDKKWYNTLKQWYKFYSKTSKVNAKTGASIGGGDRSVTVFEIDDAKINKGYKLRFESAVEHKEYHLDDVEIPLTTQGLAEKAEGTGYIKYVKLTKV